MAFWGSSSLLEKVFRAQKNTIRKMFKLGWSQLCRNIFSHNQLLKVPINLYFLGSYITLQKHRIWGKTSLKRSTRAILGSIESGGISSGLPVSERKSGSDDLVALLSRRFLSGELFYQIPEELHRIPSQT